jgi:hypothetical protein
MWCTWLVAVTPSGLDSRFPQTGFATVAPPYAEERYTESSAATASSRSAHSPTATYTVHGWRVTD